MEIGLSTKDGGRIQQAWSRKQGSGEAAFVGVKDSILVAIVPKEVIQGNTLDPTQFIDRFKRTPLGFIAQTRITQLQGAVGAPPIHDGGSQLGAHPRQHREGIGIGPVEVEPSRLILKVENQLIEPRFCSSRIAAQDPNPGFSDGQSLANKLGISGHHPVGGKLSQRPPHIARSALDGLARRHVGRSVGRSPQLQTHGGCEVEN